MICPNCGSNNVKDIDYNARYEAICDDCGELIFSGDK